MILAQSFGPFGHSGPSRPTVSSSSNGSAKPPPPAGRSSHRPAHLSVAALRFLSPMLLLRAKMGAINGCWLTSHQSSTSHPLKPYKRRATPPTNSTALILAPLSSPPLPERLAHRALPLSFAPHCR
jgi:hypothetical protein